jgi:DNA-binding response OmpR family regulator
VKILVAEDDPITRRLLEASLNRWGYEVVTANDGTQAWALLQMPAPPQILLLDWCMPEVDGLTVCRQARQRPALRSSYIMILTSKDAKDDIVRGLQAGADDYVTKPFHTDELRARVDVGRRVVQLQQELAERVRQLEEALASVNTLQALLPICSYCNKVRDDQNYWHRVEAYIASHTDIRFSHGVCPECSKKIKDRLKVA